MMHSTAGHSSATVDGETTDAIRGRLAIEFAALGAKTIDRTVTSCRELLVNVAAPDRLPERVERFARDRLRALAKERGWAGVGPAVLFLCRDNTGQSQMARGLFAHLAGDRALAWSGGSAPGAAINPEVVRVMAERGIDIRDEFPKPWSEEFARVADVVVDLGCGDTDPIQAGHRFEQWPIPDLAGRPVEQVRLVGDDIERRVRRLITTLGLHISP
ncbi:arsenate-mycothiol transferase ArsC [Nocardia sp. NPDC055321]